MPSTRTHPHARRRTTRSEASEATRRRPGDDASEATRATRQQAVPATTRGAHIPPQLDQGHASEARQQEHPRHPAPPERATGGHARQPSEATPATPATPPKTGPRPMGRAQGVATSARRCPAYTGRVLPPSLLLAPRAGAAARVAAPADRVVVFFAPFAAGAEMVDGVAVVELPDGVRGSEDEAVAPEPAELAAWSPAADDAWDSAGDGWVGRLVGRVVERGADFAVAGVAAAVGGGVVAAGGALHVVECGVGLAPRGVPRFRLYVVPAGRGGLSKCGRWVAV